MPVRAPQPQQPNPVEIQAWATGASNARQQYDQQSARLNYMRSQADLDYGIQQRQANLANRQQRQGFDDPYIGRGIFNSGIRRGALGDLYTQQGNEAAARQQQYLGQVGSYGLEDVLNMQSRDTTIQNLQLQEQARRAQLAAEIRGIV